MIWSRTYSICHRLYITFRSHTNMVSPDSHLHMHFLFERLASDKYFCFRVITHESPDEYKIKKSKLLTSVTQIVKAVFDPMLHGKLSRYCIITSKSQVNAFTHIPFLRLETVTCLNSESRCSRQIFQHLKFTVFELISVAVFGLSPENTGEAYLPFI